MQPIWELWSDNIIDPESMKHFLVITFCKNNGSTETMTEGLLWYVTFAYRRSPFYLLQ